MTLTPSERHAARRCRPLDGSPACATCLDEGVVMVGVGPVDEFGNRHTEEAPCPACDAGDTEAERRVGWAEFDAMSRAALAPAPVSRDDFLPAAERRNQASP